MTGVVRRRGVSLSALAAAVALGLPTAAAAHASLVRSSPPDRAVLARAPAAVRLLFSDDVRLLSGIKAVRNGGGSVLGRKPRLIGGRPLAGLLTAGGIAFFRFAVGTGSPEALLVAFVLAFLGGSGAIAHASLSTRFGTTMAAATIV